MGMRCVVLECHINRRGNTVMAVHDLNDELGQPPPNKWEDQFPNEVQEAKNIFAKYVQYLMEEERGEEDEHDGKLLSPKKVKMCLELETDDAGYPLLPDAAAAETAAEMKHLVRSFMTMHYGKKILRNNICLNAGSL